MQTKNKHKFIIEYTNQKNEANSVSIWMECKKLQHNEKYIREEIINKYIQMKQKNGVYNAIVALQSKWCIQQWLIYTDDHCTRTGN